MSVIAEFQIPSSAFELGRILTVEGGASFELETIVPTGGDTVPLFWVDNPTKPGAGQWDGLTDPQFEALTLAVEMGYYDIPRGYTTKELAEKLGISDQAVTERLRWAKHTLIVSDAMKNE